eukprot:11182885-Alexandrium_andersonii.AAC.1
MLCDCCEPVACLMRIVASRCARVREARTPRLDFHGGAVTLRNPVMSCECGSAVPRACMGTCQLHWRDVT